MGFASVERIQVRIGNAQARQRDSLHGLHAPSLVIGLVIYFAYGQRHSLVAETPVK